MRLCVLLVLGGCTVDLGMCDETRARRVVYDENGSPAFEGQAMVIAGCGNGSFCHSSAARGDDRFSAPAELDFDVMLASQDSSAGEVDRLRAAQGNVFEKRESIFTEVDSGRMPPFGEATLTAHAGVPRYADAEGRRVPHVDSIEGVDILRNWLACGAPVVERTEGSGEIGDTVAPLDLAPVEPTFTSIYERVLSPMCGTSCHSPELPDFLDSNQLDLSTASLAYDSHVGVAAMGEACVAEGTPRVATNDADGSLLVQKLAETQTCGDPMPLGGTPIAESTLAAIRTWIDSGAPND